MWYSTSNANSEISKGTRDDTQGGKELNMRLIGNIGRFIMNIDPMTVLIIMAFALGIKFCQIVHDLVEFFTK